MTLSLSALMLLAQSIHIPQITEEADSVINQIWGAIALIKQES